MRTYSSFIVLFHFICTSLSSFFLCTTTLLSVVCRAFDVCGQYITVFYKMLSGDMLRFGIIYSVVLPGFVLSKSVRSLGPGSQRAGIAVSSSIPTRRS